jgi:hypothetical protein
MDTNSFQINIRWVFMTSLTLLLLMVCSTLTAQDANFEVSGTVKSSEDNVPLPGVSIVIKGTTSGVTTDFDGKYSINVPDGNGTLVFSYIGFKKYEASVNRKSTINVSLETDAQALDEVVVTALGIKREDKSLGYSVENVAAEELTRVAQENVLNSLSGKVAGVTLNSTGGTGSSVSMVIRGAI